MSQSWVAKLLEEHGEAIQRHLRFVAAHETIIEVLHAFEQQTITEAQAIARLDKLLTEPARPLSKATEERYITTLAEVEEDLARLKRQQAARLGLEDPQNVIPNLYYVLSHLPTEYKKLSAERQKKMMRIVTKEVRLDMLSQHIFRLYPIWENGIAVRPDGALVWRGVTPNTR